MDYSSIISTLQSAATNRDYYKVREMLTNLDALVKELGKNHQSALIDRLKSADDIDELSSIIKDLCKNMQYADREEKARLISKTKSAGYLLLGEEAYFRRTYNDEYSFYIISLLIEYIGKDKIYKNRLLYLSALSIAIDNPFGSQNLIFTQSGIFTYKQIFMIEAFKPGEILSLYSMFNFRNVKFTYLSSHIIYSPIKKLCIYLVLSKQKIPVVYRPNYAQSPLIWYKGSDIKYVYSGVSYSPFPDIFRGSFLRQDLSTRAEFYKYRRYQWNEIRVELAQYK